MLNFLGSPRRPVGLPGQILGQKPLTLLGPLKHVHGIADKVLEMAFASLLLAAPEKMSGWRELGGSLIAVDSLVHAWLHRTGILKRLGSMHAYGPRCYQENGCASVILAMAKQIDARQFNGSFPKVFPRYVQFAIWRYCSIDALNICNGLRINDRKRCQNKWCRLFANCAR